MLSELYFPMSIIGLTETNLKIDQEEILNINIPGYNFLSQPSLSNAGGVGVFVKNGISYSLLTGSQQGRKKNSASKRVGVRAS